MREVDDSPAERSSPHAARGRPDCGAARAVTPAPAESAHPVAPSDILEAILALMPVAAVSVDASGAIVSVNSLVCKLFGYGAEELTGQPIELLVPERHRAAHLIHRDRYRAAPKTRPMGEGLELCARRKDGSELAVEISLAPMTTGERPLFIAAIHDVSTRRAATAAQAQLAAIVQSSLDAIISITLEGQITSWNPGAIALLGYDAEEMIGSHVSRLLGDAGSFEFEEALGEVLATGRAAPRDTLWRRRDGTLLDVALAVSALRDPEGRLVAFSAIARDITRRRRDEAELRRVLGEARLLERQHAASTEIRLALLSGAPLDRSYAVICEQARELAQASSALLVRPGEPLEVLGADGDPTLALEALARRPGLLERAHAAGPVGHVADETGTAVAVATDGGAANLALVLVRAGRGFGPEELGGMQALAEQAAVAERFALARDDRDRLLLASDRDRIARDLHDLVIQRLFASGMSLQSAQPFIGDLRVSERIGHVVEELDATIREIRTTVFELEHRHLAGSGLREAIVEVSRRAAGGLGFEPALIFDGPLESAVPDHIGPHVLAVLREGLSNAARHARATHVEVSVAAGDELVLVIADDGVGVGVERVRSGLANLEARAEAVGGRFSLGAAPGGGTRLEWRVPLS